MDACPPLEVIAAFLDGTLSTEERARMTEHLARCESCYEIFAGAVHFQEEESSADDTGGRGVLPFPLVEGKPQEKHARVEPARPPRRASRWLPLAASVVLATGLGYMVWQNSRSLPELPVDSLVQPLDAKAEAALTSLYEGDTYRSGDTPDSTFLDGAFFMTGVHAIDLHLSVQAKDVEKTAAHLQAIGIELQQVPFYPTIAQRYSNDYANMTSLDALRRLASEMPQRESALQNQLAEEEFFRFGLWTEAGRLSAAIKSPDFFEQRANRRFLSVIPREIPAKDDPRYEPILADLEKIAPLWDREKRSTEDYQSLAGHFGRIINQVEQIQRQDQEEDPASTQ